MAVVGEAESPSTLNEKPVVVRVKRKNYQSPLEAFWLEICERPLKRPLVDFGKLSIESSSSKVDELKTKKVFVQRVETVGSSDVAVDILQSFVASKPTPADALADALESKVKLEDRRRGFRTENKQKQLLAKAKEKQEVLAKNARFEQIWKSRKGKRGTKPEEALHDMCQLYDVIRVDVGETSEMQKQDDEDLEEQRLMATFLPLLQEFIPSAAEEVESEINFQTIKRASKDDYVYDLYAVKDENISTLEEDTSPFPLVQVDDNDDFYDGPDNSDYDTDDSNAEDNPMNDYPEEDEDEEEEEEAEDDDERKSNGNSDEVESESDKSSVSETLGYLNSSENVDDEDEDDTYW